MRMLFKAPDCHSEAIAKLEDELHMHGISGEMRYFKSVYDVRTEPAQAEWAQYLVDGTEVFRWEKGRVMMDAKDNLLRVMCQSLARHGALSLAPSTTSVRMVVFAIIQIVVLIGYRGSPFGVVLLLACGALFVASHLTGKQAGTTSSMEASRWMMVPVWILTWPSCLLYLPTFRSHARNFAYRLGQGMVR